MRSSLYAFSTARNSASRLYEMRVRVRYELAKVDLGDSFTSSPNLNWTHAKTLAQAFISQLNLTEKSNLLTGTRYTFAVDGTPINCVGNIGSIPRFNFSGICLNDGPAAVAKQDLISVFPSGITLAATWDRELVWKGSRALGEEFRAKGSHVALGPVAGPLGRHPLGGRNWEGFSPDPYLTGKLMSSYISAVQSVGVQTSSKHFIGNEQETQRTNTGLPNGTNIEAISSNIDDRTLHELYLWPFADAVRAGTTSIMCSYNRVNGTYACENPHLLNDILKGELGFQGYVVSDWFATHSGHRAANAGLDMDMPGYVNQSSISTGETYFGPHLIEAIKDGNLTEARLDDMVLRVLTPYFLLNQYHHDYPSPDPSQTYVMANIPYRRSKLATTQYIRTPPFGFDIGTLDIGGGSGSARHTNLVSPLSAIRARAATYGARVQYLTNNEILSSNNFGSIYPTPNICLIFLKTFSTEALDRTSFTNDWNSTIVVNNVARFCHGNTIVITHSSGINTLPFASNPNVSAILAAHYPGEESGNAIVDILFGDVNPSGKLPYTIPISENDYHVPIVNLTAREVEEKGPDAWQADFEEGLEIDYRSFDRRNVKPLYEFGFGLSYTTFEFGDHVSAAKLYGDKIVSARPDSKSRIVPGGNEDLYTPLLLIRASVRNTGDRKGATVVQIYVELPEEGTPQGTPKRVLRGFEKVEVGVAEEKGMGVGGKEKELRVRREEKEIVAGGEKEVEFVLQRRDISYWDTELGDWVIPRGEIKVLVGFSSRDLRGG
ncbi:hypothetical protein DID88_003034 [Monilinia fructigena]|uniref:Probable beta-glucosidase G n=1 Tax=Monilinia fructigena TaxID=38457 RepID=A0A395IH26_9HELO|nr:hypothetical protein DID88_003034 [Monilinia fructigena]